MLKWNSAIEAYERGDARGAIRDLTEIADSAKICVNIGLIAYELGDMGQAIEYLTEAVETDEYLAVGFFMRSVVGYMNRDYEGAVADASMALDRLRSNNFIDYKQLGLDFKLFRCEVVFNRALAYDALGRIPEADRDMTEASGLKAEDKHSIIDTTNFNGVPFQVPTGTLYLPPASSKYKYEMPKAREVTPGKFPGGVSVRAPAPAPAPPPSRGGAPVRKPLSSHGKAPPPAPGGGGPGFSRSSKPAPSWSRGNKPAPAPAPGGPSFSRSSKPGGSSNPPPPNSFSRSSKPKPALPPPAPKAAPKAAPKWGGGGGRPGSGSGSGSNPPPWASRGRGGSRGGSRGGRGGSRGGRGGGASSRGGPPSRGGARGGSRGGFGRGGARQPPPPVARAPPPPAAKSGGMGGGGGGGRTIGGGGAGRRVKVKCHWHDTRVIVVTSDISFTDLEQAVFAKFNEYSLILKYRDEDGDLVTMSCQDDLDIALEENVKLELFIDQ